MEEAEEQISDIEDTIMENNEAAKKVKWKYWITSIDSGNSATP